MTWLEQIRNGLEYVDENTAIIKKQFALDILGWDVLECESIFGNKDQITIRLNKEGYVASRTTNVRRRN